MAPHPLRLDDLDVGDRIHIERAALVRRPGQIAAAAADLAPDLVVVDTRTHRDRAIASIEAALELDPDVGVLALTSDPPDVDEVAQAARAGARGFVDIDATEGELAEAMRIVRDGGSWYPADELGPLLRDVGDRLALTAAERRSRLTGILLGIIPLTGVIAALMAYLWRRYTAQIGVRPVDIAVDPASRIIDAFVGLSLLVGSFGPLLLIGNWLDMLRAATPDRGPLAWLLRRRWLAFVALSAAWLLVAWFITRGPDPLMVMLIGPAVAVAIVARVAGLDQELPRFLRIAASPSHVLVGGLVAALVFAAALGGEMLWVGPELGTRGEGGILVPRIIGFNAQPVEASNVDTGAAPRQLLYLGGNADLYVLVDPCDDNRVEFVSVGSHSLEVIDEITCAAPDGS